VIAGLLLALATSVSWAFGNVLVQKSGRAIGTASATLWALVVGVVAAGGVSLALGEARPVVTGSDLGWTLVTAVAGLLAYACLFRAFEHEALSLAVPIVSSWSLVAGVLSFALFGERVRALPLVGAAVVFCGVLLVALASRSGGAGGARGGLLAPLGAALGFGVMVPALGRVAPVWGPLGATALVYLLVVALGLPLALAAGVPVRRPPPRLWPLLLATGCAETLGFVALSLARRFAPLAVVTPVASLGATLTMVYAWLVLRERPPRMATAGAVLACLGIVILAL
jgi:drug/metabolite transporter (DMT)-like permease